MNQEYYDTLNGTWGRNLVYYDELDSTNTAMFAGNFATGDVICAGVQRQGRGRNGHSWQASAGDALLFTVQLPDMSPALLSGAQIAAGYACCNALMPFCDLRLKWPNDLMLWGGKMGGLLIETSFMGSRLEKAVLGIGINLRAAPQVDGTQTAYLESTGELASHGRLLALLVGALEESFDDYLAGTLSLIEEWQHYSAFYMKKISVHVDGIKTDFIEKGITPEGFLIAEKDGKETIIKVF